MVLTRSQTRYDVHKNNYHEVNRKVNVNLTIEDYNCANSLIKLKNVRVKSNNSHYLRNRDHNISPIRYIEGNDLASINDHTWKPWNKFNNSIN